MKIRLANSFPYLISAKLLVPLDTR